MRRKYVKEVKEVKEALKASITGKGRDFISVENKSFYGEFCRFLKVFLQTNHAPRLKFNFKSITHFIRYSITQYYKETANSILLNIKSFYEITSISLLKIFNFPSSINSLLASVNQNLVHVVHDICSKLLWTKYFFLTTICIHYLREAAHECRRINRKKNKDAQQQKKVKEILMFSMLMGEFF